MTSLLRAECFCLYSIFYCLSLHKLQQSAFQRALIKNANDVRFSLAATQRPENRRGGDRLCAEREGEREWRGENVQREGNNQMKGKKEDHPHRHFTICSLKKGSGLEAEHRYYVCKIQQCFYDA